MPHNVYLLATDTSNAGRDVIHSRDTALRIRVFYLEREKFERDPNEIQLYGTANGENYAFETIDIASDDALDVVEAIQWYADYIGYPELEILPDDPRIGQTLAI